MINNDIYIGGPKGLGGMYDWDIITKVLNAKYPNGVYFSDETEASKEFTEALNKVQADMVSKSNEFDEKLAELGDSAALKNFIDNYKNPTSVTPVLVTVSEAGSKTYSTTSTGTLTNVDEAGKKAKLDGVSVNISIQTKYAHGDNSSKWKWIYGTHNAIVAFNKIGAQDSTNKANDVSKGYQDQGMIHFNGNAFASTQMYSYFSGSSLVDISPVGYFRANEQLIVDSTTSSKYGVDVSNYIGKPYAEVSLLLSGETVIVIFGG